MAADAVNESELGRGKQSASPRDHLQHLLNLGWDRSSPLIKKYAIEHGLQRELDDYDRMDVKQK